MWLIHRPKCHRYYSARSWFEQGSSAVYLSSLSYRTRPLWCMHSQENRAARSSEVPLHFTPGPSSLSFFLSLWHGLNFFSSFFSCAYGLSAMNLHISSADVKFLFSFLASSLLRQSTLHDIPGDKFSLQTIVSAEAFEGSPLSVCGNWV